MKEVLRVVPSNRRYAFRSGSLYKGYDYISGGFRRSIEEKSWHLIPVTRHVITTLDPEVDFSTFAISDTAFYPQTKSTK